MEGRGTCCLFDHGHAAPRLGHDRRARRDRRRSPVPALDRGAARPGRAARSADHHVGVAPEGAHRGDQAVVVEGHRVDRRQRVGLVAGPGDDLEVEDRLAAGDARRDQPGLLLEPLEAGVELPDRGVPGADVGADRVLDGGVRRRTARRSRRPCRSRPAGCSRRRPRGSGRRSRPSELLESKLEHVLVGGHRSAPAASGVLNGRRGPPARLAAARAPARSAPSSSRRTPTRTAATTTAATSPRCWSGSTSCPAHGVEFDRMAVLLAAWFHDSVYDAQPDAEKRSAAWAAEALPTLVDQAVVDEVVRLVLITEHHLPADDDANGCALSDADLAILAAPAGAVRRVRRLGPRGVRPGARRRSSPPAAPRSCATCSRSRTSSTRRTPGAPGRTPPAPTCERRAGDARAVTLATRPGASVRP